MRVLVVTNMYPDDSRPVYGQFVQEQVEALRRQGLDVEVLFIDGQTTNRNYLTGFGRVRREAAGRFDLVHAHYGLTGYLAVQQDRLPVVITFHGDDLLGTPAPSGGLTWKSRVARALGRRAARRARANIIVSEGMRDHLPDAVTRREAVVLPLGVDLERFRPLPREECCSRLRLDPSRFRLLFAADPDVPRKRFGLACAAAAIVRREDPAVTLHVVSGRPPSEMPLHMNASDALLLTSLHEGSPMVVKEALACNLPVVAVPAGDVEERLRGVAGCRVVPPDVEALADGIRARLRDPVPIDGRAAVGHLSAERVAARVMEVYRRALDGPCAGSAAS